MTESLTQLEDKRAELFRQLVAIGDFRRGSITATSGKCGKLNCHCSRRGDPGHGPNFRLTRRVKGKTVTEFHRFQKLCGEIVAISEKICALRPLEGGLTPEEKKRRKRSVKRWRAK